MIKKLFTLLMLCMAFGNLNAQRALPGGTVIDLGVSVDACNVLRHPNKTVFFDTNLQPFTTGATLATPVAGDFILFSDTSACGGLRRTNATDFLTASCTVIGPGTGGVLSLWLGGACSTSVGDSFIKQACGDILFDDGVNDILTFDFTTNPTGAITWTLGDVSGVPAIDNGLSAGFVVLATATDGELVNSTIDQDISTVGAITINDNLFLSTAGKFMRSRQYVAFSGNAGIDFGAASNIFAVNTGADIPFQIDVSGGSFEIINRRIRHRDAGPSGSYVDVLVPSLLKNATHIRAEMDGTIAMWGDSSIITILVDLATQSSGAVVDTQAYEFTVASGASGDFDNVVAGDLNGIIPVGTVFTANASAVPTNYDGSTIEPVVLVTAPTMRLSSDSAVAADREFKLSTNGMVGGQVVELEWTHPTNRAELLRAGIFKMSADYRPDESDTLVLRYNGANFIERTRSANQ